MKRKTFLIRYALLPFAILIVQTSFAQFKIINNAKDSYRAVHWGLNEGLSQAEVYYMIKDVNGFLWVGATVGLNRFDGSRFRKYFHDPDNPLTISGNEIFGLVEDSLHNLWVGTDKGLSRYDIRADTFTNFIPATKNKTTLFNAVRSLCATRNEVYCIEPDFQITSYNVHSFKKKNLLKLAPSDKVNAGSSGSYSFIDTVTNSLWLLHGEGPEAGLIQISLMNGEKKYYGWPCYKKIAGHNHGTEAMCYDQKRNSLWINSTDGLLEFTLSDKQFYHVDAFNDWVVMKDYWYFPGIALDKEGRVWLATFPKGIIIYDPSDGSVRLPFNNHPDLQKEISVEIMCLYIDRENITWTGYWSRKGFYQLIPYSAPVTRYAADTVKSFNDKSVVYNIINADHGRLWMGTSEGFQVFNPHAGSFQSLEEKDLPGIRGKLIFPIAIDTAHSKAWLLANSDYADIIHDPNKWGKPLFGNLYEMDVSTKKCRPVIFKDLSGHTIPSSEFFIIPQMIISFPVTPFKNGCIVIAVRNHQQCFFIVNYKEPVAKQILSFPEFSVSPHNIATDEDHFLFMRSNDSTVNFSFADIKGKWARKATPLDSIKWNKIVYNKSDLSYWIVAFQQLIHYDKNFKLIKRYTLKDGLPEFDIYGLGPDNKGNIWFNTDRSIYQLNIKTGKIAMLSEKDGFMPQNFTGGDDEFRIKDENGDIYFPAGFHGKGFDKVSPDKFTSSPSFVYVQSLEINKKSSSLSTGPNNISQLSLPHFQNNISIETGIIDYYSKGQSRIRYKLENLDSNWQYGPAYYTIQYERLPPGQYKLVMQASNAANKFNGPEKILFIHISPAFWNTWWFRIVAAICLIALFYGLIRWRLQQRFRTQLELSEREKQLADIRQKASELEMQALRSQMNPHFIFNSLNSINRFILQNNKVQASEYLTKFSKLVRLILQNSQAALIPLESELESMELYLDLEALRFDYKFGYKISVPNDMDISALKVPPLIIQPYAENAIWHGLMHKEEKGQLDIEISQENKFIYFRIADNGIGRKQSAAMASKSAIQHKSMGLRITADRIAMMQRTGSKESAVTINDLVAPDGNPAGTEVIIKLPVIYD